VENSHILRGFSNSCTLDSAFLQGFWRMEVPKWADRLPRGPGAVCFQIAESIWPEGIEKLPSEIRDPKSAIAK
jgi:hypothetical protein